MVEQGQQYLQRTLRRAQRKGVIGVIVQSFEAMNDQQTYVSLLETTFG
jgi:hypothetical protein